jgi:hypothetical protein
MLMWACRYVLFENAMSIVKLNAVIAGAFNLKGVNEWVSHTPCCRTDLQECGWLSSFHACLFHRSGCVCESCGTI